MIRLQVQGTIRAALNGIMYEIQPGDLIFSKVGDSYQLIMEEERTDAGVRPVNSGDYFMSAGGDWIDDWLKGRSFPDLVRIEVTEELLSLWRRLTYEKRNIHEDNDEMVAYLVKLLCLTVERHARKGSAASSGGGLYIPYKIKQYIERHATEALTLNRIAERYGVSVSTASHLFKQTFGQTPIRYAVEIRLSIASERILYSDMKLEDIAESAGFRSYPYFSRAFRERFNASPSEYRERGKPRKPEA